MKVTSTRQKNDAVIQKQSSQANTFLIVAIGASSGGLDAVTELLNHIHPSTGMAFIYVHHLSADHKSILPAILAKGTSMKVQEVTNGMQIIQNNLYVIPANKEIKVAQEKFTVNDRPDSPQKHFPIDALFCSLAENHNKRAIGIILSGNANDGSIGLHAIRAEGGLTFAQDSSAKFPGMPSAAISAGAVDFVLSPNEMAWELNRMAKEDYMTLKIRSSREDEIDDDDPDMEIILQAIHRHAGVDFRLYKKATIKRRIQRRMLLHRIGNIMEYAKLFVEGAEEITILYQDLLINVTDFFRDTDAHHYLKSTLLPTLIKNASENKPLRIWTAACATGQEAYSIAMTILEIQEGLAGNTPVQIFATDLSAQVIDKARVGEYSITELGSISAQRLQRFYTKSGNKYRISKLVRSMCVFAPHNLLSDPPFSRLDFISCCNLLIYLDPIAQRKAIKTFYYALNEGGYLMLGKSESINASDNLFEQVNKKVKIYSRKSKRVSKDLPELLPGLRRSPKNEPEISTVVPKNKNRTGMGFAEAIDASLLAHYMPASVVINHAMDILQFRGPTEFFLKHSTGKANLNILKMATPDLAFELHIVINKAIKSKKIVVKSGIKLKIRRTLAIINIEVIPLDIEWDEPLLLVVFGKPEKQEAIIPAKGKGSKSNSLDLKKVVKLEAELAAVRAEMLEFMEGQDALNNELQSANEEAISSNEELQSLNEELETSKEEIESANEELITTNQELQIRNELLQESYDFSEAIFSTIHEPMIILDKDLRVKSANRSFYDSFLVRKEDIEGSFIHELPNGLWNIPLLLKKLNEIVLENSSFQDFEVTQDLPGIGKKVMLLNSRRIVQQSHGEQLILLAVNDITTGANAQIQEKEGLRKDIVESKSYNVRLEKAVEERTKELELSKRTLEENYEDLVKMNLELQAFAYVSSHDLQEPLRKIRSFALRIIETENLSVKGKGYFDRMQAAAGRMQSLIQDLLTFSRVNTGERKFEMVDLNNLVKEIKVDMAETIQEKRARITAHDLCEVSVIVFQFHQLMQHLIENALKFSKPDIQPHIMITSRMINGNEAAQVKLSPGKRYCHLSISDNGIGFEPRFNERIFEVFQRLHNQKEYSGTGIGLAIVKKIVTNHGGVITAHGELSHGAKFDIYLPER